MGAYSKVPSDYFASWSEDATNITVPIASISGLTAAEADGTTGDIAEILFDLLNQVYDTYKANTAPTKWSIFRSTWVDELTNKNTVSFVISFITTVGSQTVDDEA